MPTALTTRVTRAWQRCPPLALLDEPPRLRLLDQTALPFAVCHVEITTVTGCAEAIRTMRVRGAPLIGLAAAAGMVIALHADASDAGLDRAAALLLASRPTAVNLRWALARIRGCISALPPPQRAAAARRCFEDLQHAEFACCEAIAAHGYTLLDTLAQSAAARARGRLEILTHCNAGWLATGAWGTALAPVYRAAEAGLALHVWVDETRPRNQGARLTAWELAEAGIPHTVIVDSAAGHLMQRGLVDVCIVGSDRTTRTGDVCNKIGTYQKALAAADNGVPFYVALPVSTIDWAIADGMAAIEIETRDPREVLEFEWRDAACAAVGIHCAAPGSRALNIAFDVTPARLVRALICEHGVFAATAAGLERLRRIAAGASEPV